MLAKKLITIGLIAIMVGCSSITIQPKSMGKSPQEPTYQDTKSFFLWGLVGEPRVNVTAICGEREVVQMQSQQTFVNGLLTVVTLGIYAPHSVKVWCQ